MKRDKQSFGYMILDDILSILAIPFVLFPVMLLPVSCLDYVLGGMLWDNELLFGIIFTLLFFVCQSILIGRAFDKDDKDEEYNPYQIFNKQPLELSTSGFDYRRGLEAIAKKRMEQRKRQRKKAWIIAILIVVAYLALFIFLLSLCD